MTDPQATAQPTKTYADGLREAAEIAREYERRDELVSLGADEAGQPDVASAFIKYALAARAIAAAIEAKAGSR